MILQIYCKKKLISSKNGALHFFPKKARKKIHQRKNIKIPRYSMSEKYIRALKRRNLCFWFYLVLLLSKKEEKKRRY